MLELALRGSKKYWGLLIVLAGIAGVAFLTWLYQLQFGLGITGLSRDVSWGFYIAQFTFLVGVAAGGVMVVLPYYLHDYKAFGRITILGEFLAVAALVMCLLFITVDLGQPIRMLNVLLYPTPNSMLFYDMIVLNGYLFLNIVVGWNVLEAERNGTHYQPWLKPLIYLSIPWAISIHTVTAYLYCGLPGRGFWLTAILAPRFLASAFAAGPALLIVLCLIVRRFTRFDPGPRADPEPGQDRHLRHHRQRLLLPVRGVRGRLQPDSRAYGPSQIPVLRAARQRDPGALDVDQYGPDAHGHHPVGRSGVPPPRRGAGGFLRHGFCRCLDRQGAGADFGRFRPQSPCTRSTSTCPPVRRS